MDCAGPFVLDTCCGARDLKAGMFSAPNIFMLQVKVSVASHCGPDLQAAALGCQVALVPTETAVLHAVPLTCVRLDQQLQVPAARVLNVKQGLVAGGLRARKQHAQHVPAAVRPARRLPRVCRPTSRPPNTTFQNFLHIVHKRVRPGS